MTTTSEKFAGIFGLPHLQGARDYFRTSQGLLAATIGKTLHGMEKAAWFDASNPWTASPGANATRPVPYCEYVIYVQMPPRNSPLIQGLPNTQEVAGR